MTKDLTTGKIMPILVKFTIPLVLGNLFQLTYNAVDSIIVGHFVGKEALASGWYLQPDHNTYDLILKWSVHGSCYLMECSMEQKIMIPCTARSAPPCFQEWSFLLH